MSRIEMSGYDFNRIMQACAKACNKSNKRRVLRYIELRANGTECIATSLDGVIMQQIKVPCYGNGTVLIPYTIKPTKCESVIIEDAENVKITYLDFDGNLIYAYEVPKCDDEYIDWRKIVDDERAEHVIYCNASNLRNVLEATRYSNDQVISISIPDDKLKPIRIASKDAQMIVLPIRVLSEKEKDVRKFENWYKETQAKEGAEE